METVTLTASQAAALILEGMAFICEVFSIPMSDGALATEVAIATLEEFGLPRDGAPDYQGANQALLDAGLPNTEAVTRAVAAVVQKAMVPGGTEEDYVDAGLD